MASVSLQLLLLLLHPPSLKNHCIGLHGLYLNAAPQPAAYGTRALMTQQPQQTKKLLRGTTCMIASSMQHSQPLKGSKLP